MKGASPPLILHVVHRFGVGGMENGMVNLLDHMPRERYRHAIACLSGYDDFRRRLRRGDIEFFDLGKRPGHDLALYGRLFGLMRRVRPDIVHTRNLSALEAQFVATAAGVPGRVHGEHGRDVFDLDGSNWKYNLLRRAARWLVHGYIAVSRDLADWLTRTVGVPAPRVRQVYSGVDMARFLPAPHGRESIGPAGFAGPDTVVIGSAGRMAAVKDYPTLARAFVRLAQLWPEGRDRLRLVIVGDGESREPCRDFVEAAGLGPQAWFPGSRDDVAALMRGFDVFVLPSLGEGISNTILEAMATGLPVVATRVGGNPELVTEAVTGALVPVADQDALARALLTYVRDPQLRCAHGAAARARTEREFSFENMVNGYLSVYDAVLEKTGRQNSSLLTPHSSL